MEDELQVGSGEARLGQSQGLGLGTGRKQVRHVPPAAVVTSCPCLAGATTSAPGASWLSDVSLVFPLPAGRHSCPRKAWSQWAGADAILARDSSRLGMRRVK